MTTDPHAGAELTDDALQGEIELVGDLVVAASSSDGPLSDDEIDAALGISRDGSEQAPDEVPGAAGGDARGEGSEAQAGSAGAASAADDGGASHGASVGHGAAHGEARRISV
jgi:hypothetical protein